MTARRIASIWFPRLAIERWARHDPERHDAEPVALVTEGPRGVVIDAVNTLALRGGARIGQKLADARAAFPPLAAIPSDLEGDAAALARLARWCERWTPFARVDGADALLLDLTGGAHLFGGETTFIDTVKDKFDKFGLVARIAIAPTIGAAWALARHADRSLCGDDDLAQMLSPLPVQALRLDDATCLLLHRLGLKTIAQLAAVPQRALSRRFSRGDGPWADPSLRLDQAFGRVEEPLDPHVEAPRPRATARVFEPVLDVPVLEPIVLDLATDLSAQLAERHSGARHLRLTAFRVDGDVQSLEARTSLAMRDPAHIAKLLAESLQTLDAGFGFDAFALTALWHEPLGAVQSGLLEAKTDDTSLARLIDRLSAKIGARHVRVPDFAESHLPDRRLGWLSVLGKPRPPASGPIVPERPLRLFDRPEPIAVTYSTPQGAPRQFRWRKHIHRVVRHQGPERIAPEWWHARSTTRLRDYYRVEDSEGRRYWIFRNGVIGDGRGGAPDWYLHGLFG